MAVSHDMPYRGLERFGVAFLNRFEGSQVPCQVLRNITLIDTPGVLSGEKQRLNRGYNFTEVTAWFANRADFYRRVKIQEFLNPKRVNFPRTRIFLERATHEFGITKPPGLLILARFFSQFNPFRSQMASSPLFGMADAAFPCRCRMTFNNFSSEP